MRKSDLPHVTIDLPRVAANAEAIGRRTGKPVIAVVKADAYGLGARRVVDAIADAVDSFYVFSTREMLYDDIDTGKPTIALLGGSDEPEDYILRRIRPVVWTADRAIALRKAKPVLSLDTGQNRFGCPVENVESILRLGYFDEAMSHATSVAQAKQLKDTLGGRAARLHAAGTALLDEPDAWLDAVRPGLALYHDTVRVTATLVEVRDATGPAGYGGFVSSTGRIGVFLAGYAHGFRAGGEVLVNGVRRRVPEVGMQSAFVELGNNDKVGDEVVLLGDGLTIHEIGAAWGTTPHEALLRLARLPY